MHLRLNLSTDLIQINKINKITQWFFGAKMKEKISMCLDDLDKDTFDLLTTFMTYKKDLKPLLLVSKKMNQMVSQCPSGKLASQILPEAISLEHSSSREFLFKYILRRNNIKPFCIILSCMYLLCEEDQLLYPLHISALTIALGITIWNLKTESYNYGLFKKDKEEQIKQVLEPLEKPVDFLYK